MITECFRCREIVRKEQARADVIAIQQPHYPVRIRHQPDITNPLCDLPRYTATLYDPVSQRYQCLFPTGTDDYSTVTRQIARARVRTDEGRRELAREAQRYNQQVMIERQRDMVCECTVYYYEADGVGCRMQSDAAAHSV